VASLFATLALWGLTLLFAPSDSSNLLTHAISGDRLVERAASQEWGFLSTLRGSFFHHDKSDVDDAPQGRTDKKRPWMMMSFREKLTAKCLMMQPILDCHRSCRRDHACHQQCPLPKCPQAQKKIQEVMRCHGQCHGDFECHRSCPRPFQQLHSECQKHDHEHGHHHEDREHHGNYHGHQLKEEHHEEEDPMKQRWHQEMTERMECKSRCSDEACVSQCPKPWEGMMEKCSKMTAVASCHRQCGWDHECHMQCPKPPCPKMTQRMEQTMQCHRQCGWDRECHRACPKPLHAVRARCERFDVIHQCHGACRPGDHACHQVCPKLFEF